MMGDFHPKHVGITGINKILYKSAILLEFFWNQSQSFSRSFCLSVYPGGTEEKRQKPRATASHYSFTFHGEVRLCLVCVCVCVCVFCYLSPVCIKFVR
jgi:hypothetical protein